MEDTVQGSQIQITMEERFKACMILSGVGDAMGYKNGRWEFNYSGIQIHKQLKELGGVNKLDLDNWAVSDDTVMHIATAEALIESAIVNKEEKERVSTVAEEIIKNEEEEGEGKAESQEGPATNTHEKETKVQVKEEDDATQEREHSEKEEENEKEEEQEVSYGPIVANEELFKAIANKYVECFDDMDGRAPGAATISAVNQFVKHGKSWNQIKYSPTGGGCGASMRAMCIGLVFSGKGQRKELIATSIESGRMTHNHPTGFFGAFGAALLTAFAIEEIPVVQWGTELLSVFPMAYKYLEEVGRDWENYQKDLKYFEKRWRAYLKLRKINTKNATEAVFPEPYGIKERDEFYASVSFDGWGGSSGHDSIIISYDALLGCNQDWVEFCKRGALHGGDSDSTGAIGGAWFGAAYGFHSVPEINYANLEYKDRLERFG